MRKFFGLAAYVAIVCLAIPSLAFAQATVSIDPPEIESPAAGEQFEISVNIVGGANIAGYQVTVTFDPTALKYISIANADYLPAGAFAVPPIVGADRVQLAATSLAGTASGDGTLAKATFEVVEVKESTIGLVDVALSDPAGQPLPVTTVDGTVTAGPPPNQAPVAAIEAPAEASVGQSVSLSGANSTDDGEIVSYAWDFGDGTDAGEGETVEHVYTAPGEYTITLTVTDNGDPALTDEAEVIINVTEGAQPVITEHTPGAQILWLQANILEGGQEAKCFLPIWEGEMDAQAGTFLEYQVKFLGTSVHRMGGVYVHTAEGVVGKVAPDNQSDWVHRKVSLDAIAGQTIVAITVGTDNSDDPSNPLGAFNMMVDNVQITDGTSILTAVWVGQTSINGQPSVSETFGDAVGADNCTLTVAEDSVSVDPKGKSITTWGRLKAAR
jgi:PKD repeat protein